MDAVRASLYKLHLENLDRSAKQWSVGHPQSLRARVTWLKMTDTDRILLEMADAKTTQQQYSVEQPSSLKVTRSSCTCANISLDKTTR
jgi:hypothetical protein